MATVGSERLEAVRVEADREAWDAESIARRYVDGFRAILEDIDFNAVTRVVERLREARDNQQTVFVCGNGGSAATASHWVNDLGKATKLAGRPWLKVMSLTDNTSWLTALANDEGYSRAFSGQLENFAQPGDVLVVISASGRSANLVEAVALAEKRGLVTIALLGFDGGVLKDRVDECLWLPTPVGAYGPVETGHTLLCDIVTTCLIEDRAPSLHVS